MADSAVNIQIPDSVVPFPKGILDRGKWFFWRFLTPMHHYWRDSLLALGFIHHDKLDNWSFGFLAHGKKPLDFLKYLESRGFGNHFIAWKEDGQFASVRLLNGFEWQYHIRIFENGEVRAHYETTPEGHPFMHAREIGMTEHREEFMAIFGDWVE